MSDPSHLYIQVERGTGRGSRAVPGPALNSLLYRVCVPLHNYICDVDSLCRWILYTLYTAVGGGEKSEHHCYGGMIVAAGPELSAAATAVASRAAACASSERRKSSGRPCTTVATCARSRSTPAEPKMAAAVGDRL